MSALSLVARTALEYVAGIDLTAVEGGEGMTALTLIRKIGSEVSKFATVKHVGGRPAQMESWYRLLLGERGAMTENAWPATAV